MKSLLGKFQLFLLGIPKARYRKCDARQGQRKEVLAKHGPVKQEIDTLPENLDSTI